MPSLPPAIDLEVHRTGRGAPLVALHDLGRDGTTMQRALRGLRRQHAIIAPDLRGHGASPSPKGPWSIDDFSSDVARIIQDEGPPATVVGVGLGAATALALALGHPSLVSGLVLSGLGPKAEDESRQDRWTSAARAVRDRAGEGGEGIALSIEAMGSRPDWRGALAQVNAPVMVLAGAADRAVPPADQRELSLWIDGARFTTVPRVGHDVAGEGAGELVNAVRLLTLEQAPAQQLAA